MDLSYLNGWIDSPKDVDKVLATAENPYLGACSHSIADTGDGKKQLLYKFVEKIFGKYPLREQGIGDCVGFAAAGAVDILTATEIIMKADLEEWAGLCDTQFIYSGSRVITGGGQLGNQDGSVGGWIVDFMQKYGTLIKKKYGNIDLSTYNGNIAREWGRPRIGPPKELFSYAKEHLVQTYSQVNTVENARDALYSGYPIVVCSNLGFSNKRDSEGFARPEGSWAHAMVAIAMDFEYKRPGFLIQNSWNIWNTGPKRHEQPDGSFWCDADVFERKMLSANDSWVISNYKGYPLRDIQWGNLFR